MPLQRRVWQLIEMGARQVKILVDPEPDSARGYRVHHYQRQVFQDFAVRGLSPKWACSSSAQRPQRRAGNVFLHCGKLNDSFLPKVQTVFGLFWAHGD